MKAPKPFSFFQRAWIEEFDWTWFDPIYTKDLIMFFRSEPNRQNILVCLFWSPLVSETYFLIKPSRTMTFRTCWFSFERGPFKTIYFKECCLALISEEIKWFSCNINTISLKHEFRGEVLGRPFFGIGVATF